MVGHDALDVCSLATASCLSRLPHCTHFWHTALGVSNIQISRTLRVFNLSFTFSICPLRVPVNALHSPRPQLPCRHRAHLTRKIPTCEETQEDSTVGSSLKSSQRAFDWSTVGITVPTT